MGFQNFTLLNIKDFNLPFSQMEVETTHLLSNLSNFFVNITFSTTLHIDTNDKWREKRAKNNNNTTNNNNHATWCLQQQQHVACNYSNNNNIATFFFSALECIVGRSWTSDVETGDAKSVDAGTDKHGKLRNLRVWMQSCCKLSYLRIPY